MFIAFEVLSFLGIISTPHMNTLFPGPRPYPRQHLHALYSIYLCTLFYYDIIMRCIVYVVVIVFLGSHYYLCVCQAKNCMGSGYPWPCVQISIEGWAWEGDH